MADAEDTLAVHDVSHGGLAVTLAEMVTEEAGASVTLDGNASPAHQLFNEQPGRVVIETTDADAVAEAFDGIAPVETVGTTDGSGELDLTVGDETITTDAAAIAERRSVIDRELE